MFRNTPKRSEAKTRSGKLTKGHVKALQECGVQPLTQYSTVGATTLQGKIMILLSRTFTSD